MSIFPLVSYINMHIPIVLCCGAKQILFTNKSSEYCHIIKPYLFTKFHATRHSGKRVTQTCMPYFNVWAEVVFCGFPNNNNNNTQKAAIATLPLTTHPQWAEPHTFTSLEQIHVPITSLEWLNLPLLPFLPFHNLPS